MRFLPVMVVSFGIVAVAPATAQLRKIDPSPESKALAPPQSPDMARIAAASGIFDLVSSKGPNTCRMTLWPEGAKGSFPVSMPAGCRKAFAITGKVKNWTLVPDGTIRLMDEAAVPVLEFREKDGKLFSAEVSQVVYELKPADAGWFKRVAAVSGTAPGETHSGPLASAAETGRVSGTYEVIREKGKASGCKLVLVAQSAAKAGYLRAELADGCADRGMQIFSPNTWRLETRRLIIVSRKGHDISLIRAPSGSWIKEKASGEPLELVRQ